MAQEMWHGCLDRVADLVLKTMLVNSGPTSQTIMSQGYGSVMAFRRHVRVADGLSIICCRNLFT